VDRRGLADRVLVDSCGTGHWHVGEAPDARAAAEAARRGYDLGDLRARQVCPADFDAFDYILAMDRANLADLEAMRPATFAGHLGLLLEFSEGVAVDEVPDPYHGGDDGFSHVLDLVERASEGLLAALAREGRLDDAHSQQ